MYWYVHNTLSKHQRLLLLGDTDGLGGKAVSPLFLFSKKMLTWLTYLN